MWRRTRYWVQYRKSQFKGSTTYKWFFTDQASLNKWRKNHPNTRYYTELDYAKPRPS